MKERPHLYIMGTQLALLLDLWHFMFHFDQPECRNPRNLSLEKVLDVIERGNFQLIVADHHGVSSYCLIEGVLHPFIGDNMEVFHNQWLDIWSTFEFLQQQLHWTSESAVTWERFIRAVAQHDILQKDLC